MAANIDVLPVALTIAGYDPSAGAGILADLKTFAAHGIYGEACITCLTVQSTQGVQAVTPVDAGWIGRTLANLEDDSPFSCIKIGAIWSSDTVEVIAEFLAGQRGVPAVCDPVVRSTSGMEFLSLHGMERLRDRILPRCAWVTPNWDELAILTGRATSSRPECETAARELQADFPHIHVLVTGGAQANSGSPDDFLLPPGGEGIWVPGDRVETRATHGTGCTLSAALAATLALYPAEPPAERVAACKRYVEGAMRHAQEIGRGPGPLHHFWEWEPADLRGSLRNGAGASETSTPTRMKRRM